MERAAILCKGGLIIAADLPLGWVRTATDADLPSGAMAITIPPGGASLKQLEREIFLKTLALAGGNQSRAAHILGLCESTFRFRLHKLGIQSRRTSSAPPPQLAANTQTAGRA
jgi:DNA-binding NtrC family response regulator